MQPFSAADDILRCADWTTRSGRTLAALPRLLACVGLFGAVYGATMGAYRGFTAQPEWLLQLFYSAVKTPLLLVGAFALTLPTFFVLSSLFGLRRDFSRAVRALVAAQAGMAIVLASLAPLTLLVYSSTTDYDVALLTSGLFFLVAALCGQSILRFHFRPLVAQNRRHRTMLIAWGVAYAFVAIQLAWLLRPFFGAPGMPVHFFRPDVWDNAYVVLMRLVWQVLGG